MHSVFEQHLIQRVAAFIFCGFINTLIVGMQANPSTAFQCAPQTQQERIEKANLILTGKVLEISPRYDSPGELHIEGFEQYVVITFDVQ